MRKAIAGVLAVLGAGLVWTGSAAQAEETAAVAAGKPQTTCPVMAGNPVNTNIYVDYQGQRIYFCCRGCPPEFNKHPETYLKQMRDAGIAPADAPKAGAAKAQAGAR